jgi:hypothetical protein
LLDLRNPAVATTYVALGDSYSAGEGLAPYLPGSNTKTDTCHRSRKAYSQLLTTPLLKSFHACSQVKIAAYFGNTEKSHEPAQRGYLDSSTALLTMTLGGNNLDWTKVLSSCTKVEAQVTHRLLLPYRKGTCTKNLEAVSGKITAMVNGPAVNGVRQPGLLDVYRDALRNAPLAQIRVLGYPPIFPDRGNKKSGCRIARINLTDPVHNIPPTQLVLASDVEDKMVTLQAQANRAIRDAVALVQAEEPDNRRLSFVDIEGPFGGAQGHTISCGDTRRAEPWINAVKLSSAAAAKLVGDLVRGKDRFSSDLFSIYSASFHPKERGQQAMAEALAESI